jgi:hypothetical protein
MKVKLLEKSGRFYHYQVIENKKVINSGWYKMKDFEKQTTGDISKAILSMYKEKGLC